MPTIELVWGLYLVTRGELLDLRSEVLNYLEGFSPLTNRITEYQNWTVVDARKRFDDYLDELELMIILDLFTFLEGRVRADFEFRVRQRKRDVISRAYRDMENSRRCPPGRVPFEDLFEIWKSHCPSCRMNISHMKGLWNYRNWLAHGRWWVTKFGPLPVANNVKMSIETLLNCLEIPFS